MGSERRIMSQVEEQTPQEAEIQEPLTGETPEGEEAPTPAEEPESVIVTFGEEPAVKEEDRKDPKWLRELRKTHRETVKEKRKLEEKLREYEQAKTPEVTIGPKPTLEGCEWDPERYEEDLTRWYETKRKKDEAEAKAKAQEEEQTKAWQARVEDYGKAKTSLEVDDFEEAESEVFSTLSQVQQGILIQGCTNPAQMVYALGKSPAKAKELASITDPVKFAFAAAKLEAQIKMSKRNPIPPPEKVPQATGRNISGTVDSTLERLREEAARSGDYTKVTAYKRQIRDKQS
jgi:hypothetical protein